MVYCLIAGADTREGRNRSGRDSAGDRIGWRESTDESAIACIDLAIQEGWT